MILGFAYVAVFFFKLYNPFYYLKFTLPQHNARLKISAESHLPANQRQGTKGLPCSPQMLVYASLNTSMCLILKQVPCSWFTRRVIHNQS
jgi:hypothetical protein